MMLGARLLAVDASENTARKIGHEATENPSKSPTFRWSPRIAIKPMSKI